MFNLRKIWSNLNISTVLVLPLFSHLITDLKNTETGNPIHFIQLMFDRGLVNTFLFNEIQKYPNSLSLVFYTSKVNEEFEDTTFPYKSVNEFLIGCEYFLDVMQEDGLTVYILKIPEEFWDDIVYIISSKYSKVSKKYKNRIRVKTKVIQLSENELGLMICKTNLASKILTRSPKIKQEIEDFLDTDIPENTELFEKFSISKETLNKNILKLM